MKDPCIRPMVIRAIGKIGNAINVNLKLVENNMTNVPDNKIIAPTAISKP